MYEKRTAYSGYFNCCVIGRNSRLLFHAKEIRNLSFFQSIITNEIMLLLSALYGKNDVENDAESN